MNSGFASFATKGRISWSGTHQKFDRAAYRLVVPRVSSGTFPTRREILHFEGYDGPDGLKVKGPYTTDHLWDPVNELGFLPVWIDSHFKNLVAALKKDDMVEASFHAGWMAHYLTDSLTPAHHVSHKLIEAEYEDSSKARRRWLVWGRKGLMSTHVAFESGVSSSIIASPLRPKFDDKLFEAIKEKGISEVVKEESLKIAKYNYFEQFLKKGWTPALAKAIKATVIPRIPQLIAAAWLAAYEASGHEILDHHATSHRR